MKRVLMFLGLFLILASIVGVGCSKPAPSTPSAPPASPAPASSAAAPSRAPGKIFTVDLRTMQLGTQSYIIGTCIEELTRNHPWIRASNTESPGATWAIEYMAKTPEAWPNTTATFSLYFVLEASKGVGSYKDKPLPEMANYRGLWANSIPLMHFNTFDPKIKTVNDLQGKRIGLGPKGGGVWSQIPTLILEALGIKATLEYLGNAQATQALIEGKVDAAICNTYSNYETTTMVPNSVYLEAIAVPGKGKDLHVVDWGEANAKKLPAMLGPALLPLQIKANSGMFQNQPEAIWLVGSPAGWGIHKTFPEDVAYELVKLWGQNYKNYTGRHSEMKIVSVETMAKAFPKELYHPGSLKAFQELGVKF